jgi:hypothetical protein
MSIMNGANKQPVHSDDEDDEIVKLHDTMEPLGEIIGLVDNAVADANRLRDEWVNKNVSYLCQSLSTCKEEEQNTVLNLLMEARSLVSKWVKAIAYALMMQRKVEVIVDKLRLTVNEEVEVKYNTLIAVKARINCLGPKWQQTLSDVEKVSQYTIGAVERWKVSAIASKESRKKLDSGSTYQDVEEMCRIADNFYMDRFRLPHEMKDTLLQLETRLSPLFKAYFLNSTPYSMDISQEEATKNVQKAVLAANETIAQMIHFMDTRPVKGIAPLIERDKILKSLAAVKIWAFNWDQVVTSAGNAIWKIVQEINVLLSTVGKDGEHETWSKLREETKEMVESWYPYMYGIQKLYHYSEKAETGWRSLPDEKRQFSDSWYQYELSAITDEEQETIRATLSIRYQFDLIFGDDVQDDPSKRHVVEYNQNHFAQLSYAWILFQAKLLEPGTPSFRLFDTENPEPSSCPLFYFANLPSQNIEYEAVRWIKIATLKAEQRIVHVIDFMEKWPKHEEVSLRKERESLKIVTKMKNLLSHWSQAMSAAKKAIEEILSPIQVLSIVSKNNTSTYKTETESILQSWCQSIDQIADLSAKVAQAEDSWQALVIFRELSATDLFLSPASTSKKGAGIKPSAHRYGDEGISLDPAKTYSSSWIQENADFTNETERKAIIATWGVVDSLRRIEYLTGKHNDADRPTIDSYGQIKLTTCRRWRTPCISYDWMLLRNDLLNL